MPRALFGVTVAMTAQAFLRDQMSTLVQRGWDVHLACSPADGTNSFTLLSELDGITVHPLPMERAFSPLRDLRSLAEWVRLIRSIKPEIVIASTPKAGLLGTLAAKITGVPRRIYHVRGLRLEGLRGPMRCASFQSERLAVTAATEVLVDSPSLLDSMRELRLLPQDKGLVLGKGSCCGVDSDWFRPPGIDERKEAREALGVPEDEFVIGFIGRLHLDKGVRDLVQSITQLFESNGNVRLVLVGPGEDNSLKQELTKLNNESWVTFVGRTDDTRSMYWAFDVFSLPSYREGFPISVLEAQACGLPVVTTTATGCRDSIEPDETGLLVPAGNVELLFTALKCLQEDIHLRSSLGCEGRNRILRDFEQHQVRTNAINFIAKWTSH